MSPKAPKVERIRARPTVIRRRRWKVVDSEEPSVIWKRLAKRNFEVLFWEAIDEIDEQRRKDAACFISNATYYSKRIENMPSNYSRMLRDIVGNQKPGGVPQGRSTYAWSRIGEKDGEEGSEVEESDTPVIAAGVLTVVTVIVIGSWLWIRNVRG
ncbi:hypothetical protein SNOG_05276 [Parastagonospora nodorum SN15]|uniref:Uncharacterized protein n=2 Tax=Phaeosphaeria nodorum (strain SN15 / ATCC MYA-4574 / FGSC 10173) TaxID=321614 RepID=Q0USI8_PHANO|nr:hypothetical protein SNOG_05276 [Parastagonospora nodorum SN15]EAT87667.2 hypothetical protein SNOG_05276 [Parastagonospora nodorum SN15]